MNAASGGDLSGSGAGVPGPGADLPGSGADLPARSRGVIGLLEENCTVCMLCARECPDWCIYIESHKEPMPAEPGAPDGPGSPARRGGRQVRNALDRFAIDFSLCMYCGICIEVCPYDALFWSPEFSYAETDIRELTHERGRLREWMWTVPPPPAHDPGAPVAKEVQAVYGPGGVPDARGVLDAGGARGPASDKPSAR
jgi:NADH-quinone oxidoreductase subunit I